MNITELNGKTVCVLGYGREGKAMVSALEQYAPECNITIADSSDEVRSTKYEVQLGEHWLQNLNRFDVIIISPGIPPNEKLSAHESQITNSTQIFLDSIDPETTVIGVTGSKGKSTTASLLYAVLKEAGKDTILLGNIGDAAIAHLGDVHADSLVVLEMSSYQLMRLKRSPQIAVITSMFPEHLNYHGTLEAYTEAKKRIATFQNENDIVFFYSGSEGAREIAETSHGTKQPYSDTDSPVALEDTHLIGAHNLHNIAGAAAVCRHLGIQDDGMRNVLKEFRGLPHRLQDLGIHHGIRWIDDAISTTPESAMAALQALAPNVKVLIAGGQDRGNDFTELGTSLPSFGVRHIILMGESAPRIQDAIRDPDIVIHHANSITEAVDIAKTLPTTKGGQPSIALLSPASPSYGMFRDFEEKGEAFANAIHT